MNKVYIELVFLDNFMINGAIILLASVLTKSPKKPARFVAAAALGGLYACISAVFGGVFSSFGVKSAIGLLMCFIAYYVRGGKNLLSNICAFYATTFVFAGAVYAAAFANGNESLTPLLRYILVGISVGAALILLLSRVRQRALMRARQTAELQLTYAGKSVVVRAYVDTGNLLTAPMSSTGVVFVTSAVAASLFDKQTVALMRGDDAAASDRLRIIAASTASGSDVFYGIEIDDIAMKGEDRGTKAVVCIAKTTLTEGCGAIVGPPIMDKLMRGTHHDNTPDTKDRGMGSHPSAHRRKHRLHQRQRGASAAAHPAGGSGVS